MITLYNIIHGAEFWLALAIWGSGAIFGICVMWIAWALGERRDDD